MLTLGCRINGGVKIEGGSDGSIIKMNGVVKIIRACDQHLHETHQCLSLYQGNSKFLAAQRTNKLTEHTQGCLHAFHKVGNLLPFGKNFNEKCIL